MRSRRTISGVLGAILFLGAIVEACRAGLGFYQDYYLIPKEKYGVLTPLRWQDVTFLVAFWLVILELIYISYRLMKYALSCKPSVSPTLNARNDL
jgi:hypothetical protein